MLGICYGMQAMVQALGGRVEGAESGEFGRTELTLRDGGGELLAGLPETQSCWMSHRDAVFEPPRGVHGARLDPGLAGRRLRGARSRPLRDPVPPRGRPHALRDRGPDPFPARDRRLRGAVVAAVGDRRAGRQDQRPGRRGPGDLRPLGRRRLLGRGAARPPGGGGEADLRLRRSRPDAAERGRAGRRGVRAVRHPAGPRRRRGAVPRAPGRGRRARAEAEDHRRGVHPGLRGGGGEARGRRATWSRGPSTRT